MALLSEQDVVMRLHRHIDEGTTDLSPSTWREPVEHYLSAEHFSREVGQILRRLPVPFCPSAALPKAGSFVARDAAAVPVLAVRGRDGTVRAFRNACRHRGTQLALGDGCRTAFVCPYHGWTYGLDGALRHVPHQHGFPDVEAEEFGLSPLITHEKHGLVFVAQNPPDGTGSVPDELDELAGLELAELELHSTNELDVAANWKILADGFLEGYHLRATHPRTFYPIQFDNLNVVEQFGRNNRIAFPYQRINKLRHVAPDQLTAQGVLTFVYQLFPNVVIGTFPYSTVMAVLEPLGVSRTRMITYVLVAPSQRAGDGESDVKLGMDFYISGQVEDNAMAVSVQAGLESGANTFLHFGQFEGALTHFHRELAAALENPPGS